MAKNYKEGYMQCVAQLGDANARAAELETLVGQMTEGLALAARSYAHERDEGIRIRAEEIARLKARIAALEATGRRLAECRYDQDQWFSWRVRGERLEAFMRVLSEGDQSPAPRGAEGGEG